MTGCEYELKGGNLSTVSTDGNVIYKDKKPQSYTVQRYLKHLSRKGITFCPSPLGFSGSGKEMLSFVKGCTIEDYPCAVLIDEKINIMRKAADMLKELHNASADFVYQGDNLWFLKYDGCLPKHSCNE